MSDCIFDPVGVPRKDPIVALPAGNYLVSVKRASVNEKDGNKSVLAIFTVLSPTDSRGKDVIHNFNIVNTKHAENERISRQQFANFLDIWGLGKEKLTNINTLVGKSLKIYVTTREYQGEMRNNVSSFMSLNDVDLNQLRAEDKGENPETQDVPF